MKAVLEESFSYKTFWLIRKKRWEKAAWNNDGRKNSRKWYIIYNKGCTKSFSLLEASVV